MFAVTFEHTYCQNGRFFLHHAWFGLGSKANRLCFWLQGLSRSPEKQRLVEELAVSPRFARLSAEETVEN